MLHAAHTRKYRRVRHNLAITIMYRFGRVGDTVKTLNRNTGEKNDGKPLYSKPVYNLSGHKTNSSERIVCIHVHTTFAFIDSNIKRHRALTGTPNIHLFTCMSINIAVVLETTVYTVSVNSLRVYYVTVCTGI